MSFLRKLLGVGRSKPPNPEDVQHDIDEASSKMTNVESSLRSLRLRLEVISHREQVGR